MKKLTQEEFIEKANIIHNYIYDYSKSKYINNNTKIIIDCKIHGLFEQFPNNHLSGRKCFKCSVKNNGSYKKHTLNSLIKKANIIHDNKYNYSLLEEGKISSTDKVIIICPIHGNFQQKVSAHFKGHGCRKCSHSFSKEDIENSFKNFLIKANIKHNNIYDYSQVRYIDSKTKVNIICSKHGIFKQSPNSHIKYGCNKCGKLRITNSLKEFIKLANLKHNFKYDYSESIYVTNKIKIKIICKEHGEFYQTASSHLKGYGCSACAGVKRLTLEEFILRAQKIHGNIYNYSQTKFQSLTKKINIICKIHGEFVQSPNNHLLGHGCGQCNLKQKLTLENLRIRANNIHQNKYLYPDQEFKNVKNKIIIICPKHDKFEQRVSAHLLGSGCPKCSSTISKIETRWLNYLNIPENFRNKIILINNKKYQVDALDLNTKTIYEFYGDFYHGNPKVFPAEKLNKKLKKTFGELFQRTIEREDILKQAGYSLITIWETDFNNKESV